MFKWRLMLNWQSDVIANVELVKMFLENGGIVIVTIVTSMTIQSDMLLELLKVSSMYRCHFRTFFFIIWLKKYSFYDETLDK